MSSKFIEMLNPELFTAFLAENELKNPTEVQREAIPPFLAGENLTVLAKTGTGKTYSYLLPLFQKLKESEADRVAAPGAPRAVIILPIKELATQVNAVAKTISHHVKLRVRVALGGDKGKRVTSLKTQNFDILIGGPGRIKSMLTRGEINLENLEHLIIDEADQLLDMGFMHDLKGIRKFLRGPVQVGLYSATVTENFDELIKDFFSGVEFKNISLNEENTLVQTIETYNVPLHYTEKQPMLNLFMKDQAKGSGIIFVNQKSQVTEVASFLMTNFPNKKVFTLHGDMSASDRKKSFENFKTLGGVLVTTDMAARGIDIKKLNYVLNYDLPFESVYYIHRSGRVGRCGNSGRVFNFVTSKDQRLIAGINEAIKKQSSLKIDPIMLKKARSGSAKNAGANNDKGPRRGTNQKRKSRYSR